MSRTARVPGGAKYKTKVVWHYYDDRVNDVEMMLKAYEVDMKGEFEQQSYRCYYRAGKGLQGPIHSDAIKNTEDKEGTGKGKGC